MDITMRIINSGRLAGMPYSLSRWTDIPGSPPKWGWMMNAFREQGMWAFDPRTAVPSEWSLCPEDTLGLIWWTKNPQALITEYARLRAYNNQIHMTLTGWEEVERGAPKLQEGLELLDRTAHLYGPDRVLWRFSPVPQVPDVVGRFTRIARVASGAGIQEVYLSFLQTNDLMPETRTAEAKLALMREMAAVAEGFGMNIRLCAEDQMLRGIGALPGNLSSGVCVRPESFALQGQDRPPSEGCGCVLTVDPFTVNESCSMSCTYCYAGDHALAPKKHNTTRGHLTVLP